MILYFVTLYYTAHFKIDFFFHLISYVLDATSFIVYTYPLAQIVSYHHIITFIAYKYHLMCVCPCFFILNKVFLSFLFFLIGLVSRRVMVMEFIDGIALSKIASEMSARGVKPGSPESLILGRKLLGALTDAYSSMIFGSGIIHGLVV